LTQESSAHDPNPIPTPRKIDLRNVFVKNSVVPFPISKYKLVPDGSKAQGKNQQDFGGEGDAMTATRQRYFT